jgi:drug/metabolite transporter (DMT)-like permease
LNSAARTQSLWMIGASLAFTGMVATIKVAAGRGVPLAHIIFYRGAFSVLVMSLYLKYRHLPLGTPHWRMHLRRGLAGYGGLVSYVAAVSLLPLATAVSLNYTSPLLLAVMLAFLHRERPERAQLFALAGGLCGVVLLLRPTFDESQWFAGLIALSSAVLAAWTALNIRALGRLKEYPVRTVLYFSVFITVATLPWFLLSHPATVSPEGSLAVLAAAVFAAFGQIMLTLAYQRGNTLLVSLLGYSQVVFTSVVGVVIWNDQLPTMSWIGMALVIASGGAATMFMRPAAPSPAAVPLGLPARSADIDGG